MLRFPIAAGLRQAIVSARTDPVAIGDYVEMETGAKNTETSAIGDRVDIDTNT